MRDYSGIRVLVLDGASRQILGVLCGLHDLRCEITTVSGSKLDNGYMSRYPKKRLLAHTNNKEELLAFVLNEVKTKKYDVLLALSDGTMDMVTKAYVELSQYVRIPFPQREIFMKAYNKQETMEICMNNGIPCPITKRENETIEEFIAKVGYPIVAKPRMACGSMGLKIIRDKEQLYKLIEGKVIEIDEYVFQEYIPQTGTQYNVHLFMDDNRNLASNLVTEKNRWYPIDGGASCMCRTTLNQQVHDDAERLLKAVKWRSYCEIEMIEDPRDGISKVMEINGRASASIKIMYLAGINVAKQMLQLAYGEEIEKYDEAKEDIRMRCLLTDVLWFLQSPDRFTRKPSWFSFVRTHDVIFKWKDPIPFFTFIIQSIPNYRKAMQQRKRT